MASITLKNLTKKYGNTFAIENLNLEIKDGEFFILLGPSGCGKSTTLLSIAGLIKPEGGEIWIGDDLVASIEQGIFKRPQDRDGAMVFQDYALYPHMTVFKNIVFPLEIRGLDKNEVVRIIKERNEIARIKIVRLIKDINEIARIRKEKAETESNVKGGDETAREAKDEEDIEWIFKDEEELARIINDKNELARMAKDKKEIARLEKIRAETTSNVKEADETAKEAKDEEEVEWLFKDEEELARIINDKNEIAHIAKDRIEIAKKVKEAADRLGITDLLDRKPSQLSGGQRQRVALARAIVRNPKVFLMDEPLSNLDAKLRDFARAELKKLHEKVGTTFIYVTHDQLEAMSLGDRIAILNKGSLEQLGTPEDVYNHPANVFVAGFIGTPPINIMEGILIEKDGKIGVDCGHFTYNLASESELKGRIFAPEIIFGIRPENVKIAGGEIKEGAIIAEIYVIEPIGRENIIHLKIGEKHLISLTSAMQDLKVGDNVSISFDEKRIHIFDKKTQLALDPNYIHPWVNYGIARKDQGDLKGAIEAYEQAIALDPNTAIAWYNLGIARKDQGDLKGAIKAYERAVALNPKYVDAWVHLGATRSNLKDFAGAITATQTALKLSLEQNDARSTAMAYYNLGCYSAGAGKTLEVIDFLKKAIKIHNEYANIAKQDASFDSIRSNPEFLDLISMS
ncbi:MAG: ABC transporter ATPase [Promethearchaeota archaeon CR_4]|nr:MAG: ABC transporter ATPase [Candidatus Lokiarchaeota archaeon CR_4]